METLVERPRALDVHKAQVTACVRVPAADGGGREQHVAEFPTTVAGSAHAARLAGRAGTRRRTGLAHERRDLSRSDARRRGGQCREIQTGRPALRAPHQLADAIVGDLQPRRAQEHSRRLLVHPQVVGSKLQAEPAGAQKSQRKRRAIPRGERQLRTLPGRLAAGRIPRRSLAAACFSCGLPTWLLVGAISPRAPRRVFSVTSQICVTYPNSFGLPSLPLRIGRASGSEDRDQPVGDSFAAHPLLDLLDDPLRTRDELLQPFDLTQLRSRAAATCTTTRDHNQPLQEDAAYGASVADARGSA